MSLPSPEDRVVDAAFKAVFAAGMALKDRFTRYGVSAAKAPQTKSPNQEASVQPLEPSSQETKREEFLRELAAWPDKGHDEWKKLTPQDQALVLLYMAGNYGNTFASRFLEESKRSPRPEVVHAAFVGLPWLEPERAIARGYALNFRGPYQEWWVHPSGRSVLVIYDQAATQGDIPKEPNVLDSVPEDEDPAVQEAQAYAEDRTKERDELLPLIEELHQKVDDPKFKDLYVQYIARENKWNAELHENLARARKDLRKEVETFNPENKEELEAAINKLKELERWNVTEKPRLLQGLPAPEN